MLGWLCIAMSVVVVLIKLGIRVNPDMEGRLGTAGSVLEYVAAMTLPFLLIANFARILNNSEGYKKQLLRNGVASAAIFLVFNLFFNRYIIGAIGLVTTDPEQVLPLVDRVFRLTNRSGFLAFNIFIDLFLCTLFMLFLNHRPTRVFTGKKVIIFRLFAILPVAYEVCSMVLKVKSAEGSAVIPFWAFPLLAVKPPMTFVVFMVLAIFVKTRERRFRRNGKTHEDYREFLQTNRNSWHFSVFLAILLVVAAIFDFVVMTGMLMREAVLSTDSLEALQALEEADYLSLLSIVEAVGFGGSVQLIFVAPIVLLFSYTRVPKSKTIGTLIPIIGIALIAMIILQGIYQIIAVAPIPRIDIKEISDMLEQFVMSMGM